MEWHCIVLTVRQMLALKNQIEKVIHYFIGENVFVTAGGENSLLWMKPALFINSNVAGEQGEAHENTDPVCASRLHPP